MIRQRDRSFRQRHPDGEGNWRNDLTGVPGLPYRLPELLEAIEMLRDAVDDREVIILLDNDDAGRTHADNLARALNGAAASVRICRLPDLPEAGDVSDFLAENGEEKSLLRLALAAPQYLEAELKAPNQEVDTNWYKDRRTNRNGVVLANHANLMNGLRNEKDWNGVLAFDEMRCCAMLLRAAPVFPGAPTCIGPYPREWADNDSRRALEYMQALGFFILKSHDLSHAIEQVAQESRIHPLRDRLNALVWDGISRIDGETTDDGEIYYPFAVRFLKCGDSPLTQEIGRVLLLGAVTRLFEPGCKFD